MDVLDFDGVVPGELEPTAPTPARCDGSRHPSPLARAKPRKSVFAMKSECHRPCPRNTEGAEVAKDRSG